jgi:hypothetical protein
MQSTEASCGPTGVSNACKALGLNVSEAAVVAWVDKVKKSNAGAEGTTEELLTRAITEAAPKKLRLRARGLLVYDETTARDALTGALRRGAVLLAVDGDTHWVTAVGLLGDRVLVADGAEAELVVSYSWEQVNARWMVPGNPAKWFGLVIWRD